MQTRKRFSRQERLKVYSKCGGHCAYCGKKILFKDMQIDHVASIAGGGTNDSDNLLPACRSCNFYKSDQSLEEFRAYMMTLLDRLRKNDVVFNIAERWGFIEETNKDKAKFYFETLEEKEKMQDIVFGKELRGKSDFDAEEAKKKLLEVSIYGEAVPEIEAKATKTIYRYPKIVYEGIRKTSTAEVRYRLWLQISIAYAGASACPKFVLTIYRQDKGFSFGETRIGETYAEAAEFAHEAAGLVYDAED